MRLKPSQIFRFYLNDLYDTDVLSPSNGDVLSYNTSTSKWESTSGGFTDEGVKIDSGATAGYLGAASNDGVLRTSAPLTYTDGGNFVTLDLDETAVDHDVLTNSGGNQHIDWTNASDNFSTSGTLGCGNITSTFSSGEGLKLIGIATGNTNLCYISWYDSNGTTRRGYIGDASSSTDDIYLNAETGYLRLLAAGYISLGTHTYFPDDVVMSFGASLDYSIGYYSTDDEFQIIDGTTLDTNVRLKLDSSGHFDFGAGNLSTTGFLTLSKSSGKGIKVDTGTPTFGWRDLLGDIFARNTGQSKPTFTTYRGALLDYQFAAGDEEYLKFHIPHDYVAGTDIHLHVHWSHNSANVTGGTVTFEYEISYAKGHNQAVFGAPVGTIFNGTAVTGVGGQYKHIITEVQISAGTPDGNQIDSDDLEPDGVIMARFELNSNDTITDPAGGTDPFIHYVDIHYQSTNIGTKNKIFDFYA